VIFNFNLPVSNLCISGFSVMDLLSFPLRVTDSAICWMRARVGGFYRDHGI
jgi:hypothetical protein